MGTRDQTLPALMIALVLGCGVAQKGNLQFAIESLGKCDFEAARSAAQDVRTSGPSNSEYAVASLLVEAYATQLAGGDPEQLYLAHTQATGGVSTVAETREKANESFEEFTRSCR